MKTHSAKSERAFTLIEMLMVMVIIAILASHLLPAIARAKTKAYRIQCVGNLKEVGYGFQLYANDHHQKFPMEVRVADGGTWEYVRGGNASVHFGALRNELSTPKMLICPADTARVAATNWVTFTNANLSFFIGLDAKPLLPNSILAGDRNISDDSVLRSNVLQTNFPVNVQWTTDLHNNAGNILFTAGHVSELNTDGLRAAFQSALSR